MRSDVEPILLSADAPAPRQIAEAVKHRTGLTAIHLIAHGAPGQVNCGARPLASETLEDDGEDLAAIGKALGSKGSLLLWSCQTAAGERGTAFVDALARATGVEVSAAAGLVGAVALGGQWELDARGGASEARAPLTADGRANYAGVMATQTWTGGTTTSNPSSGNWGTSGNWSGGLPGTNDDVLLGGTVAGDYTVTINTTAVVNVLDSLTINFTAGTATLGIGSRTLSVNGNGAGATQTVSVGTTDIITIAGGTLNTGTLSLATSSSVTGSGTLNISGHYTGTGRLFASGGTLDVFGTVDSGVSLQINTIANSTLKLEGTATSATAISITSANQTLEVGTSGSLTIGAAQTVTNGKIQLDGASSLLTVASDITLSNGTISGLGYHFCKHRHHRLRHGEHSDFKRRLDHGKRWHAVPGRDGERPNAGDRQRREFGPEDRWHGHVGRDRDQHANQTLEIGATGSLTITAAESITNGKIIMGGGTLTDAAGITIGSGATLSGKGTVSGPVNGTGTITANGGTLEFTGAVDGISASSFHIANVAGSVLKFDGAVGTASIHPTITFDGGLGVLDLSSATLSNFHAIVANFTSGEGIKVAGAADVVLDPSGLFFTVYDAAHNSLGVINLSASYIGNEFSVSGGTISVAVDATTPTGVTPDLAAASDSGLSSTDDITNIAGLTFNVALNATVAVGDTVQLLLGGAPLANPVTHTITFADRDAGSVNLTITAGDLGANGSKSISAKFSDLAGHVSTTSAIVVTLDTTIATPTVALSSDTGSSGSDHDHQQRCPYASARPPPTSPASFTVDGGVPSASYTAPTADGAHNVVVTDTDTAGNTANASISFTLTPP